MSDSIEKMVDLRAPVERVWRAITDHVEFGTWFRVKLDGPFVLGERTTGRITYPGYEGIAWAATVEAMEPMRLFAFRWAHPERFDAPRDDDPTTLVEFRLSEVAGGTRLVIVESGFDAIPPERRREAMRNNEGGWREQLGNIRVHVDG
ncbi:SRPBCC family protein [Mangrovicella endophytica]|uniref:SRPBCC family protein n=1 Tax=Mangrovicella endophytica TaxID=2066697 RepID=UPI000C9EC699|nr:SRPBCC family protein [Mangrovicella endophytica]